MKDKETELKLQGWCPRCHLRSVQRTESRVVCTSPECGWEAKRSTQVEGRVFNGAPNASGEALSTLKSLYHSKT